jgi:hypothetical protein
MPDQLQLRGGTTVQHSTFTGASKEITVDTTKKTVVVHDGTTAGGIPVMREDASNAVLALGSAATPSIKFTGDTDTGIYSPGANQVALSTGGTGRLFVDASGNVGIGSTPVYRLDVSGGAGDGIRYLNTSNSVGVQLGASSSSAQIGSVTSHPTEFLVGAVERARIDTSGRFLVGTSSTSKQTRALFQGNSGGGATAEVFLAADTSNPGGGMGNIYFSDNSHNAAAIIAGVRDGGTWTSGSSQPISLQFYTTANGAASPTERLRIGSNGNTFVGTTTAVYAAGERLSISPNASSNAIGIALGNTNNVGIGLYHGYTATGSAIALQFQDHNAVVRGSITVTTSATAYNTSSDYRLKENVAAVTDGITRLQQLKPSRFNFTADPDKTVDGFIAHEAQAVVPECVTGEKDAVDADGNPVYQGIDQSKLVPLLTAALQEAITKIETLETRLSALEGV